MKGLVSNRWRKRLSPFYTDGSGKVLCGPKESGIGVWTTEVRAKSVISKKRVNRFLLDGSAADLCPIWVLSFSEFQRYKPSQSPHLFLRENAKKFTVSGLFPIFCLSLTSV